MGTKNGQRKARFDSRDNSHEIEKIDRDIDRLTAQIERFGFGSWEARRAEHEVRNLKSRKARLLR